MKALAIATLSLALSAAPAAFAQTTGGGTSSAPSAGAAGTGTVSGGAMGSTGSKSGSSRGGSRAQDLADPLNPLSPQTDY